MPRKERWNHALPGIMSVCGVGGRGPGSNCSKDMSGVSGFVVAMVTDQNEFSV